MASPTEKKRNARLAAEDGTIIKDWKNRLRVALVYPNHYPVGMANLGFQTVYQHLNAMEHLVCERAFLPDFEDDNKDVRSFETGRPLRDFDCVAFSLSFENDYPNVLTILEKAALPLRSAQRGFSLPLIMAGGVAVFLNPEPLAPFFDCFLIGEAESLLTPFFNLFDPHRDRQAMLLEMARGIEGVYVPHLYEPVYGNDGTLDAFTPVAAVPERIARGIAIDIDAFSTNSVVVTPESSFDNAFLVEVSRGCPHGCRFCAAGYLYRPPRMRSVDQLAQSLQDGAARSRKIGLVGTAVSDLPALSTLCRHGLQNDLQLSFSSLRADALDVSLIDALNAARLKTATIAPEVGSQRMRQVINKGLDETDIFAATQNLVAGGIPNLKLYFMVGLPTETDADIDAIVDLVVRIKSVYLEASRTRGRMGTITVSVSAFVPKPFTPFQWFGMVPQRQLKHKLQTIKSGLKGIANVRVHADVPRWAVLQALFARGDRRVADLLTAAHTNGGNWPQTFKAAGTHPDFFVTRHRERNERLPWDFIDHGIRKSFLWREYQRAMQEKASPACPMDPLICASCGACGESVH